MKGRQSAEKHQIYFKCYSASSERCVLEQPIQLSWTWVLPLKTERVIQDLELSNYNPKSFVCPADTYPRAHILLHTCTHTPSYIYPHANTPSHMHPSLHTVLHTWTHMFTHSIHRSWGCLLYISDFWVRSDIGDRWGR